MYSVHTYTEYVIGRSRWEVSLIHDRILGQDSNYWRHIKNHTRKTKVCLIINNNNNNNCYPIYMFCALLTARLTRANRVNRNYYCITI